MRDFLRERITRPRRTCAPALRTRAKPLNPPIMEIYIHIPFCKRKCAYCDFASYAGVSPERRRDYIGALKKEIRLAGEKFRDRRIDTAYIGGGTPSLLSGEDIADITDSLSAAFPLFSPVEFTIEVNPESTDGDKLKAFRAAGINRVSMGVQSLDDRNLVAAGRLHNAEEALKKLRLAREIFDNVSCDFIIGLPFDTPETVVRELNAASALVKHVSVYELTLEEGTPLALSAARGETVLPSDDCVAELLETAVDALAAKEFRRYEVSNFARTGYESRHNRGYWTREEYVGLGAAAHSFFGERAESARARGIRVSNPRTLAEYVAGVQGAERFDGLLRATTETVEGREAADEEIMLGLRTSRGVDGEALRGRITPSVARFFESAGEGRLRLTRGGLAVMNSVLAEIL